MANTATSKAPRISQTSVGICLEGSGLRGWGSIRGQRAGGVAGDGAVVVPADG